MWERTSSGSAEAALRRLMADSRPAANDGARRLSEVRRRVRERCRLANEDVQHGRATREHPGESSGGRSEEQHGPEDGEGDIASVSREPEARRLRRRIDMEEANGNQMSGDNGSEVSDSVLARGVSRYVDIARAGPGDPSPPSVTDAVTRPTSAASVAGTVAGGVEVAGPQCIKKARVASGTRGKATFGPPRSAAALREDTTSTTGERRGRDDRATSQGKPPFAGGERPPHGRELDPPQKTPVRLGAGPSSGLEEVAEHGERPANQEIARRRDGDVEPPIHASAARGSGDAAALDRREEVPSKGTRRRARGARHSECRVLDTSVASACAHHPPIGPVGPCAASPSPPSSSEPVPGCAAAEPPSGGGEGAERIPRNDVSYAAASVDVEHMDRHNCPRFPGSRAPSRGIAPNRPAVVTRMRESDTCRSPAPHQPRQPRRCQDGEIRGDASETNDGAHHVFVEPVRPGVGSPAMPSPLDPSAIANAEERPLGGGAEAHHMSGCLVGGAATSSDGVCGNRHVGYGDHISRVLPHDLDTGQYAEDERWQKVVTSGSDAHRQPRKLRDAQGNAHKESLSKLRAVTQMQMRVMINATSSNVDASSPRGSLDLIPERAEPVAVSGRPRVLAAACIPSPPSLDAVDHTVGAAPPTPSLAGPLKRLV